MTTKTITVAVAQIAGTANVDNNISAVKRMAAQAAARGASLILFPEATMYDFSASAEQIATAADQYGEAFEARISEIAAEQGIAIVIGTYRSGAARLARNMLIAVGPRGDLLGQYQKLHLYDAFDYKESLKNESAPLAPDFGELTTFELGGFRFGLLNCYDLRFPEIARLLVDQGAEILLVASAWVAGPSKAFHWETLIKARAIENTCFVAASCQPAPLSVGLSMVLDPTGIPIGAVPDGDGLALATLDADRLAAVRDVLPCLEHRRYRIVQPAP